MQFIILRDNKNKSYCLYRLVNSELVPQGICVYYAFSVLAYRIYLEADGVPFNIRIKNI